MVPSFINPEISIKSSFLTLDGSRLRADVLDIPGSNEQIPVSPDKLEQILNLGRKCILDTDFYRLWVVRLGNTKQTDGRDSQVYSRIGYDKVSSVLDGIDEIHEQFHDYWHVIEAADFIPEVRITTGKDTDGSWMLLGKSIDGS